MSMKSILCAAVALMSVSLAAEASPIYSSFASGGTPTTVGGGTFSESFTTGSSGAVNDIVLALTKTTGASGSVVITLWSDNGSGLSVPGSDAPGSLVATIGTVTSSSLTIGLKTIEFYTPTLSLSANTEYWIQITKATGPTSTIGFYLNTSAPTIGGNATIASTSYPELFRSGTTNAAQPPELQLCVSTDGSCAAVVAAAAPEPSALSILGFGIAVVGFGAHRRRWISKSAATRE
jgi:hypothetical protein